jgi:hypothetical protein
LQDLAAASERYGRYQVIEATLKSSSAIDGAGTRAELERLGRQDAREAAAVNERLASEFGARIRSVSDPAEAKRLATVAQQVFGSALATRILSEAAASPKAPPTSQVPATPATDATASAGAGGGNAGNAGTAAPTAAGSAGGTASSARTTAQNNTRLAMARPSSSAAADQAGAGPRLPPDIACSDRLAGYGRRRQAVCYDTFSGGGRGPDMVVIPAGGGNAKAFALGRTEVSNADYGIFCTRTGHCPAPAGQPDYPVINISLDDAKAYVKWLSQVTGESYRLPTDSEWTHAVTAQGGNADLSSVNCLVEIGGKKVKGEALEPALSGSANGWGLYNALGNAQEWVLTGSEALVRGGAYSDSLSSCTADAKRSHPDTGDAITGLRVLRELP